MTRVLIATASEITRSWFAAFPSRPDGLSIVGIAARDAALAAQVHELTPDVVLIDVTDGEPETIASSLESVADPAVDIVLLMNGESWHASPAELLRAGVRGVLPPQPTVQELEATVRAISAGFVVLEPRMLEALAQTDERDASGPATTGSAVRALPSSRFEEPALTPREIDVLNALAEGLGNKQIAARLAISEHTVKTHLAAIFEKLEASNRTEAVMTGARLGLVLL